MLITPYDLLLPAGAPATIEVEVEQRWLTFLDPPIAGAEIEVEGVGRARTGPQGIATFSLGILPAGLHRFPVKGPHRPPEAVVRIIERETPILVVDIDQTIADVSPQGFIFKRVQDVRPVAGAPAALQHLSKSMQILYLSARDHIFTRKTKLWLRVAGFPEAPVYLRKGTRFWSASPREHKIKRLGELRPRFPNIPWGIGDRPGDVAAYRAHGIRPILLAPAKPPDVPLETLCVPTWEAILEVLRQEQPGAPPPPIGQFPAAEGPQVPV